MCTRETRLDDPEMLALGIAPVLQGILLIAAAWGLVWWLCASFIQRRMGMTRLVVCLAAVAAPFMWPLIVLYQDDPMAFDIWSPLIARLIVDYWLWVAVFAAVPIAAALAVLFWRPEDLLRWTPTGKGWQRYRVGHVVTARNAVMVAHTFESVGSFRLLCDPVDQAAAAKLGVQLQQSGSRQVDIHADLDDAANVLLVTNRTSLSWLKAKTTVLEGKVITVVGTAIALPQSLNRLWHRQWLDHRRWDLRAEEREQGLPNIPESVKNVLLPRTVAIMHGLQCAYAALLFSLGGETTPEDSGVGEVMSSVELMSFLTALLGLVLLYPASQFLIRSMTASQLRRWLMSIVLIGTVLGLISLHQLWLMYGTGIEVITSFMGLAALPILGWHQCSAVSFWLPLAPTLSRKQRKKDQASLVDSLAPGSNWRTLLTFALFAFAWLLLMSRKVYS